MNLLYIKVGVNIVSYDFSRLRMVHHAHKLVDVTLEKDICELLCLDLLFISDKAYCLSLDIKEI